MTAIATKNCAPSTEAIALAEKIASMTSACFFAYHGLGEVAEDITPDNGDKQLAHLIVWTLDQHGLIKR
jgi:hypothetical protein